MKIQQFTLGPIEENSYIVSDESGEAVIIDCGCFAESEWGKMKQYIEENSLKITHLLNTHLHFDHTLGNRFVLRDYGLKAEASPADNYLYEGMHEQMALFLGERITNKFDITFTNEKCIPLYDVVYVSITRKKECYSLAIRSLWAVLDVQTYKAATMQPW